MNHYRLTTAIFLLFLCSCSVQHRLANRAKETILNNPDFAGAHIGITIYDPVAGRYLYDHNGDKLFVPASNTKLLTCYAAMKYLGDSLPGLYYSTNTNNDIVFRPTGDPSFLHPDFKDQRAFALLKQARSITYAPNSADRFQLLGRGWAWDDFDADYMPERSTMPVYGNVVTFRYQGNRFTVTPSWFYDSSDAPAINAKPEELRNTFRFSRREADNRFYASGGNSRSYPAAGQQLPFTGKREGDLPLFIKLLADTLHTTVQTATGNTVPVTNFRLLHSQPTDSLLAIMMHRSDNFFAEQSLLMVSGQRLGYMNDAAIIDSLLKSDYKDMPQKPKWVDGSGLSRYNLISPRDFVWLLNRMKQDFTWERITAILPTGGTGTLASYYKPYRGRIFAKTGSLSNHLALSGFLLTKNGAPLIFSVLVNAETAPAANIRKGVEKFLTSLMEK